MAKVKIGELNIAYLLDKGEEFSSAACKVMRRKSRQDRHKYVKIKFNGFKTLAAAIG